MGNVILYPRVIDNGLNTLADECDEIHVCKAGAITDYASAIALSCGKKDFGAGNAFGSPAAGSGGGRIVTSAEIINGTIDDDGDVVQWCAVDSVLQNVLAVGAIEGETFGSALSYTFAGIQADEVATATQSFNFDLGAAAADRYVLVMAFGANECDSTPAATANSVALDLLDAFPIADTGNGAFPIYAWGKLVTSGDGSLSVSVPWNGLGQANSYRGMAVWVLRGLSSTTPKQILEVYNGNVGITTAIGDFLFALQRATVAATFASSTETAAHDQYDSLYNGGGAGDWTVASTAGTFTIGIPNVGTKGIAVTFA